MAPKRPLQIMSEGSPEQTTDGLEPAPEPGPGPASRILWDQPRREPMTEMEWMEMMTELLFIYVRDEIQELRHTIVSLQMDIARLQAGQQARLAFPPMLTPRMPPWHPQPGRGRPRAPAPCGPGGPPPAGNAGAANRERSRSRDTERW